MSSRKIRLGDFLIRSKIPVDIEDNKKYKRVTIRTKHQGVSVRDFEIGSKIGTKKQFILKAGQFVLSKIDAMYGAFGIAPDEVDGAIITGNFWAYDYDKNIVSIEWFNHFTNSPDFYDLCRRASTGITHRKYLDEDFFLSYEVNLPDLNEQENLVVSIDSIREKISSLENELTHQLTLLENLNQAILQEAVQGKLVKQDPKDEPASELLQRIKAEKATLRQAQGKGKKEKPLPPIKPEEIPFEIPENWVWCRLGEICEIKRGKGPKYSEMGVSKMLNQKCIRWYEVDLQYCKSIDEEWFNSISDDFIVKENDVLVNSTGDGTIGRSAIAHKDVDGYVYDSHILKITSIISQMFICYYINSNYGQEQVNKSKGATSTKQHELGVNKLSNFTIPLPPLSEQKRIVAEIEKQFAKTKQLKEHIIANQQATEQLLKALLHQAFEVKEVETV
ncbi:MAG TPA: restriction endonuclease subunit S [Flavobacterium sp.]|nr:restriction endonuclease subunit S [Flavobacterium sp.]